MPVPVKFVCPMCKGETLVEFGPCLNCFMEKWLRKFGRKNFIPKEIYD